MFMSERQDDKLSGQDITNQDLDTVNSTHQSSTEITHKYIVHESFAIPSTDSIRLGDLILYFTSNLSTRLQPCHTTILLFSGCIMILHVSGNHRGGGKRARTITLSYCQIQDDICAVSHRIYAQACSYATLLIPVTIVKDRSSYDRLPIYFKDMEDRIPLLVRKSRQCEKAASTFSSVKPKSDRLYLSRF